MKVFLNTLQLSCDLLIGDVQHIHHVHEPKGGGVNLTAYIIIQTLPHQWNSSLNYKKHLISMSLRSLWRVHPSKGVYIGRV